MKWEQGRQTGGPGWKLQQRVGTKIGGRGVGSYNQENFGPWEKRARREIIRLGTFKIRKLSFAGRFE